MASSKKSRARRRRAINRAQAQQEQAAAASAVVRPRECMHGCPEPPPTDHVIYPAYNAWADALLQQARREDPSGAGCRAIAETLPVFPEILKDDETRSLMKSLLITNGTNILLQHDATDRKSLVIARGMAEAVFCLEDYERCEESASRGEDMPMESKQLKRFRDFTGDGRRGVTLFFAKRIGCSCLEENRIEAAQLSKKGQCYHCLKEFDHAKLMKCSRCQIAHYCSKECQRADWPQHKEEICKKWSKCIRVESMNKLGENKQV